MLPKWCAFCELELDQSHDGPKRRAQRRFCNRACFGRYLAARVVVRIRARAPKAPGLVVVPDMRRVARWSDLPDDCPACHGAWHQNDGGVHCIQCGRDLFVQTAMDAWWAVT